MVEIIWIVGMIGMVGIGGILGLAGVVGITKINQIEQARVQRGANSNSVKKLFLHTPWCTKVAEILFQQL